MIVDEKTPKVEIDEFLGLYDRGTIDKVPKDHAVDCNNILFNDREEIAPRRGFVESFALGHAVTRQAISTISGVSRLLTLDNAGNIYVGNSGSPILSDANITDFVVVNMFNKTFLLPICSGSTGPALQVFDGTTMRDAAGFAPVNGGTPMSAVDSATPGNIPAGVHKIAVSYITDTGYITKPGPTTAGTFAPATWTATGGLSVDISDIPTGGPEVVARQLFATKADLEEYFYIPNGYINDNTTTSGTFDFLDTDLVISADSLFDLIEQIGPSGSFGAMAKYHGRLIVGGFNDGFDAGGVDVVLNPDLALASNSGSAESFSSVAGVIQLPSESDSNTLSGIFVDKDVLYLTKPRGIYSTVDNLGDPSTWPQPTPVDSGVGAIGYGVSSIDATRDKSTTFNCILLGDAGGLYVFDGYPQQPALTYKVESLWASQFGRDLDYQSNLTVYMDSRRKLIYIHNRKQLSILVGDYTLGLDPKNIRWSIFTVGAGIANISLNQFTDDSTVPDDFPQLRLSLAFGLGTGLYRYSNSLYSDDITGSPPLANYQTYQMKVGGIAAFVGVTIRQKFFTTSVDPTVNMEFQILDQDNNVITLSNPIAVVTIGNGKDYFRPINYTGERISLNIRLGTNADGGQTIAVAKVTTYGNTLWQVRPS